MVKEILVNKASTPSFEKQQINLTLSSNFNRSIQEELIILAILAILDNVSAKIKLWYLHRLKYSGLEFVLG